MTCIKVFVYNSNAQLQCWSLAGVMQVVAESQEVPGRLGAVGVAGD